MIGDGNFISQVPLFGGLDDAQQVSLQQKMGHTTLRRGETLFDEGDLGDRLYIVTEGKVKLGHTSSDGRESLLAVLGPGENQRGLVVPLPDSARHDPGQGLMAVRQEHHQHLVV